MSDKTPEQFVMEWLEWAKNRTTVGIVWPGPHIHDAALMIEDWAADGERILVDTQEQLKRTVTDYKNLQETYRYETKQLKDTLGLVSADRERVLALVEMYRVALKELSVLGGGRSEGNFIAQHALKEEAIQDDMPHPL